MYTSQVLWEVVGTATSRLYSPLITLGEIYISLLNFKSIWAFSISDKRYL